MVTQYKNLINGQMVGTDDVLDVVNPANEEVIGQVPSCGEMELSGWKGRISSSWESLHSSSGGGGAALRTPSHRHRSGSGVVPTIPPPPSSSSSHSDASSSIPSVSSFTSTAATPSSGGSALVLETKEVGGLTRHYLIPDGLQKRVFLRRRGVKLHLVQGHAFRAKHVKR